MMFEWDLKGSEILQSREIQEGIQHSGRGNSLGRRTKVSRLKCSGNTYSYYKGQP